LKLKTGESCLFNKKFPLLNNYGEHGRPYAQPILEGFVERITLFAASFTANYLKPENEVHT